MLRVILNLQETITQKFTEVIMAILNINIPEPMKAFVDSKVGPGRFERRQRKLCSF